jgi:hypothetical protein
MTDRVVSEVTATQKLCPLSFSGTFARCVASQCMAWRWGASPEEGVAPKGFCGMAGLPWLPDDD